MPEYCEIKFKGHLDKGWSEWFSSLELVHLEENETMLFGTLPDQVALFGIIDRIRDLNLTLISITCSDFPSKQTK